MTGDCPTPRDVAERVIAEAERIVARQARVEAWNAQMDDVVDVILDAVDAHRGVIIQVSRAGNRIDARSSVHVAPGRAAIFDHDHPSPRFVTRTIRTEHLTRRTA